ncbi:hypothetical protein ACEPAF_1065 [Sanghuangporus sanghuang]
MNNPFQLSSPSSGIENLSRKLSRHHEFWFSDGSVVLLAQDVLFRVHKSFLARHSLVFRDMFSLPQPPTTGSSSLKLSCVSSYCEDGNKCSTLPQELLMLDDQAIENGQVTLDGCHVVCLHDFPGDVESLLYALYDGPKFGDNSAADFRVVSGVLRLASKYVIDGLRTRALAHLSTAWPSTLKGWDAREEANGGGGGAEDERFYPNPVEVINLAREVNAPSLLPSAFYDLSRYPLSDIFQQCQRNSSSSDALTEHPVLSSLAELSLADTQRLALGKEASQCSITALIRSLATDARSNPSHMQASGHTQARRFAARHQHRRSDSTGGGIGRCASPATCWRDVCELVDLATQHYLFDRERGASDPLYVAEELGMIKGSSIDGPAESRAGRYDFGGPVTSHYGSGFGTVDEDLSETGTCRACARAFEIWASRERERLWRAIPGWFRLDQ